MKLSKADIPLLRGSLLTFCAAAIVSAGAWYGGKQYAESYQKEQHDAQNRLNDVRRQLMAARADSQNLSAYSGEYGALEKRKIIGDEQRLDLLEGLENIRQQHLVTDFHYNIAPQKIYAPHFMIDRGNFDIRYSEMKLQFDLLHEVQLLNFLAALHSRINGWYHLEGCTLRRSGADEDSAAARLTAECSGGWITMKNRNAPQ